MFNKFPKMELKKSRSRHKKISEIIYSTFLITIAIFLFIIMVYVFSSGFVNLITISFMLNAICLLSAAIANLLIILLCKYPEYIAILIEFISGLVLFVLIFTLNFIEIFRVQLYQPFYQSNFNVQCAQNGVDKYFCNATNRCYTPDGYFISDWTMIRRDHSDIIWILLIIVYPILSVFGLILFGIIYDTTICFYINFFY